MAAVSKSTRNDGRTTYIRNVGENIGADDLQPKKADGHAHSRSHPVRPELETDSFDDHTGRHDDEARPHGLQAGFGLDLAIVSLRIDVQDPITDRTGTEFTKYRANQSRQTNNEADLRRIVMVDGAECRCASNCEEHCSHTEGDGIVKRREEYARVFQHHDDVCKVTQS